MKNIRPIPQELIEMMDMITRNAYKLSSKREKWTKKSMWMNHLKV